MLSALLLPPTGLALLTVLALLLGRRAVALLAMLTLVALSMPLVSMPLLASLAVSPDVGPVPGAIVVMGADVDRLDAAPGAALGSLSLERVRAGAALQRGSGLPVLVTGGLVNGLPIPVGTLMADSMGREFMVPVRWTEAASLTTWDNAALSAPLLRAAGIARVHVVTHAWHMRRSILAWRRFGIDGVAAPVRPDPWPTGRLSDFVPSTAAWQDSFFAIHEWVGLAVYAARR